MITKHAQLRLQQRGCTSEALQMVLWTADRRVYLGSGCVAVGISNKKASALRAAGLPNSVISRAAKLTLLISEAGDVITALKGRMADRLRTGESRPRRGGKRC